MLRRAYFLSFLVLASTSRAGPPFSSDDPIAVEKNHWEIYLASAFNWARHGGGGTGPHLDWNYGIGHAHLHLQTPLVFSAESGSRASFDYGDTEVGSKIELASESKLGPAVAIYPAIDFSTGSARRGFGSGATHWFLPIWFQKTFGEWTAYGGVGFWSNPGQGNRDYWFSGIVVQRPLSKRLALGVELFNTTSAADGEPSHLAWDIGATYDFDAGHHGLLSLGKDIHGGNDLVAYLGFQWTFRNWRR